MYKTYRKPVTKMMYTISYKSANGVYALYNRTPSYAEAMSDLQTCETLFPGVTVKLTSTDETEYNPRCRD